MGATTTGKVEEGSAGKSSSSSSSKWKNMSTVEDLSRSVLQSTDSAIRSARTLQHSSSTLFQSIQDFVPQTRLQYKTYEDVLFKKVKDQLASAKEHPAVAVGIVVAAALLLAQGPRKFLFRQTFGRLQSEEAQFGRAEKNVKELSISVNLMKKESEKLLERASLAEGDMKRGHSELMGAGSRIQSLAKSVYKAEAEAAAYQAYQVAAKDIIGEFEKVLHLMDVLREIPGREALKLRAEVASMASTLQQRRIDVDKRIMKISELGIPV